MLPGPIRLEMFFPHRFPIRVARQPERNGLASDRLDSQISNFIEPLDPSFPIARSREAIQSSEP